MSGSDDTTSLWALTPKPSLGTRIPALLGIGVGMPRLVMLREAETVLGRGQDTTVVLEARGVSREHAKIVMRDGQTATLVDLESRNGTFVNGERIDLLVLTEGDEIHLGPIASFQFVHRIADELERASRRVARTRLDALTPREAQVAREVARGGSNKDIAARLSIKPRTVAAHLEHTFAKLDIGSRAELTRLVTEDELTTR
ncbi:MAG: LuxR C-terminal-related transcriptional regulator [Nannocystaceae bacterium]|nr:LuxR C-terminal-related transcriptional regulator [Nannocystaceae bacterium]